MSYEYSSDQKQLDFPNPYRVENILWALRAGILVLCAIALLLLARKHLAAQEVGRFIVPVAMGTLLFVAGAWNLVRIAQQLRVFFGRGQPAGLARELAPATAGTSAGAEALMQTLRQGALEFAVPAGALNGVLYSLVPNLITAPAHVQDILQNRFSNLAAYTFLLLSMAMAEVFVWGSAVQGWVGAFYLGLVLLMALKPVSGGDAEARVRFNLAQVVLLVLAAVLGPVALSFVQAQLPDLSWAAFGSQAFVILLALTIIEAVFFVAVQKHIDPPPPVSKVDTLGAVSFNADPNLLMQELDREMQRNWVLRIPNRCYARQVPQVALGQQAGNFKGLILEETQPLAPAAFNRMDWSTVRAYPRFFWLMVIDVLGVALTLAGALALVGFAVEFDPSSAWRPVFGLATLGMALIAVGGYAFRSAHTLWGRFDFESTLSWVEMEGSFIRSKVDVGNRLQDRVFTERAVISVENMTLRVWVTHLRSVVFGHRSNGSATHRIITGMVGDPGRAEYLKDCIESFAAAQSIVLAPGSAEDGRRMVAMARANQLGDAGGGTQALSSSTLGEALLHGSRPEAGAGAPGLFCSSCGTRNHADAVFCEGCGHRVPAEQT